MKTWESVYPLQSPPIHSTENTEYPRPFKVLSKDNDTLRKPDKPLSPKRLALRSANTAIIHQQGSLGSIHHMDWDDVPRVFIPAGKLVVDS